jgi:hypothetical protein
MALDRVISCGQEANVTAMTASIQKGIVLI